MPNNTLRRYTELPAAIYLLVTKSITLLDPHKWEDINDSHYLSVYKKKKRLRTVLAACFTQTSETYHHWKIFAGNSSGVCIIFDKAKLTEHLRSRPGLRLKPVSYRTFDSLRSQLPETEELPFTKRHGYRGEEEFRIIFRSKKIAVKTLDLPIPMDSIVRIVLSPWLPIGLRKSVASLVRSIDGCKGLEVTRSTLINNKRWKDLGEFAS